MYFNAYTNFVLSNVDCKWFIQNEFNLHSERQFCKVEDADKGWKNDRNAGGKHFENVVRVFNNQANEKPSIRLKIYNI